MDIEQLKLILDMVSSAGDGAFVIAIIYFAKSFLLTLVVIGSFLWSLKSVLGTMSNAHGNSIICNELLSRVTNGNQNHCDNDNTRVKVRKYLDSLIKEDK